MGYLVESNTNVFDLQKLEVNIRTPEMQTLHSSPVLLYTATGVNTFLPVYAFITGDPSASYSYNKLYFQDPGPTLTQGLLNLQNLSGGILTGSSIFTFNVFVNSTGVNGIRSVNNRDLYLKAENADDLTGSGDMIVTIYYLLI